MELNLKKLSEILKKNKINNINYTVPDLWFLENYKIDHKFLPTREVMVNPYDFYSAVIDEYLLPRAKDDIDYSLSYSKGHNIKSTNGEWIKRQVLYSMMIRTESSYDSDRSYSLDISNIDGLKETGTFVKTLALLPFLKRLGVTVVYLLPLSKYSLKDKKGELGSPYGVESFTKLDPLLKDTMTGTHMTLEEEFKCFVEACHILSMRVTIDIIPRTNSVCSELVRKHPDWFYWIKASEYKKYKVPKVEGLGSCLYPSYDLMDKVYESADVIRHIKMFKTNPKDMDIEKWNKIKGKTNEEFIEAIEKEFDLKIAPAFSDNINDPQPAWTDVTFFRLYLDDPVKTRDLLKIKHNPYILFDVAKSNLYPGEKPNKKLWDLIASIIPYYQTNFGIDGARIDMGHALPDDLLKLIMNNAKSIDDDFAFIAEELNMANDKMVKENGYNAMIGNGFWALPRVREGEFKRFIDNLKNKMVPCFASVETHDSRRCTNRYGGRKLTRFMTILNYFLPNAIPFINSGQEIYEIEPMNLGCDASLSDLTVLDKDDIFYGKLALFDKYAFHYRGEHSKEIMNHLVDVIKTRNRWLNSICDINYYVPINFYRENSMVVGIGYYNDKGKMLIILANSDMDNMVEVQASINILREKTGNDNMYGRLLYSTYEFPRNFYDFNINQDISVCLNSGEVKIIEI
ncbi:alpha-amylase [bacterium]|nr:alpha-amylase [bacterium]